MAENGGDNVLRLTGAGPTRSPLNAGGGDGTSNGMEARVAKLEAHVEHIRSDLAKLAPVPAELAAVRERLNHLPTKIDVKLDVDGAVDRSASRVQRTVAIVGGAVTIAIAAINYLPKLLG